MPTLKKEIIKMFAIAPTVEAFANNKVIFLTPMGIITGSLPDENTSESNTKIISAIVNKTNEYFKDVELSDNDGYIQLTDASLRTATGSTCNLGDIVLFVDQIIGVTLGTIN